MHNLPKVNTEPSPVAMSAFAKQFSKQQWAKLCGHREFISTFTINLIQAKKIAETILRPSAS